MKTESHPFRTLSAKIRNHDAFSRQNFSKIAAFYLKLAIQEPFRMVEKVSHSDTIQNHSLEKDPIFIIGHWRSGTSFLQYLLGRDPQFGYMNKFQVVFPDVFLQFEELLKPFLKRIPETLNIIRDAQNMSINLDFDSPSEIEIALTTMISPTSLHWGHIFPQDAWDHFDRFLFFDTASRSDIQQWKHDYHHLIRKISLKNDGRQLLIKSPGNTARINKILELYPNARFIFIHRNPYDVFYSSKKLWRTLTDNLALQDFSEEQMEQEIIRVYQKLMSRYFEQRKNIPEGQLVELRFNDFISNPIKELYSVYQSLQLDGFGNAKPKIYDFLDHKTNGKSSDYSHEDRIISLINKKWDFTFNLLDYSMIETSAYAKLGY